MQEVIICYISKNIEKKRGLIRKMLLRYWISHVKDTAIMKQASEPPIMKFCLYLLNCSALLLKRLPQAKKMPSGNWRCRVYDKVSKSQKSFTAPTRAEAEYLAQEWLTGRAPQFLGKIKKSPAAVATRDIC